MQWTMITVTYTRQPKTTVYRGSISVVEVTKRKVPKDSLHEKEVGGHTFQGSSMESIIRSLQGLLQKYPEAKVTMVRPPAEEPRDKRPPPAYELDENMRNTIRDDLPEALKLFAPIDMTIKLGPTIPTIQPQEK